MDEFSSLIANNSYNYIFHLTTYRTGLSAIVLIRVAHVIINRVPFIVLLYVRQHDRPRLKDAKN